MRRTVVRFILIAFTFVIGSFREWLAERPKESRGSYVIPIFLLILSALALGGYGGMLYRDGFTDEEWDKLMADLNDEEKWGEPQPTFASTFAMTLSIVGIFLVMGLIIAAVKTLGRDREEAALGTELPPPKGDS